MKREKIIPTFLNNANNVLKKKMKKDINNYNNYNNFKFNDILSEQHRKLTFIL